MNSPFDQNPEQEPSSDQSYERNLARNYPADERAGIRASDQRAAYQAATLKLNAEKEAQNVKDTGIRLGIEQAKEARAVLADKLADAKNSAENAFKEREREFEQKAAEQVAPMLQEIKKRRNPAGYLSFADQTEIDLMFTFASQSKNPNITKMRDQERSLATNIMEREAANSEIRAKEERVKTAATAELTRISEAATKAGAIPTRFTYGGITSETTAKADAAEAKTEMVSLEKERKLSVDQFAKARNARTRAGIVLATALKTENQDAINAANDLVKAADDDVIESRTRRDEAESALKVRLPNKTPAAKKQPQATVGDPNGTPTPAAPAAPAAPVAPANSATPAAPAAPNDTSDPEMNLAAITRSAQQEAIRRYPEIGTRDSAKNTAFLAAYWEMKKSGKTEFFDDPEWPIALAEELAKRDGWKRSNQPVVKTDSITPEEYNAPRPAPAELKQYASEADARKSGAKAGDIIILINPKTGKPGRARLD
jgi:hypothetical protein